MEMEHIFDRSILTSLFIKDKTLTLWFKFNLHVLNQNNGPGLIPPDLNTFEMVVLVFLSTLFSDISYVYLSVCVSY